ncbi:hypothetical protein C8F04DRAFT_1180916 [Mycena alexandri]|uniref:Uncharacterized protein n=1 Tax=Mycena alexandri TaxID=1745969 RepID=A0AAD6X6M4_9AGAR|nr:hypothetical protein C8F04DRAFT_1180916 [Mycena alexandri]
MNQFYRTKEAANRLEAEAKAIRAAMASQRTEVSQHLADLNVEEAMVIECGSGRKSWRICVPNPSDGIPDEVVFAVQGIICRSNLVPTNVQQKALRLTQHLEITGFETGVFEEAMTRLEIAQDIFAQHFCGLPVIRLSTPIGRTGRVLGASNRLFTLKVDSPTEQGSEFQPGMDPLGALERLKTEELIHAPENIVRYYKRSADKERTSYDTSFPGIFRPGDVAEMHASLIAIQTGDKKIKVRAQATLKTGELLIGQAATVERILQKSRPTTTVEVRRRGIFEVYAAGRSSRRSIRGTEPVHDKEDQ